MQHDGQCRSATNQSAIHFDVVAHARLCAEICANFAVDDDATRRDQLITMSARSEAGGREETVEAHRG
jgi:hypothetical protein